MSSRLLFSDSLAFGSMAETPDGLRRTAKMPSAQIHVLGGDRPSILLIVAVTLQMW